MPWFWILAIIIASFIGLALLLIVFAISASRGGRGKVVISALMRLPFARRLALKFLQKTIDNDAALSDALATSGASPEEAKQVQEIFSSMSQEDKGKLLELSLRLDQSSVSEREGLLEEASSLVVGSGGLSRAQRRQLQRADSKKSTKPPAKKKKRRR